MALYWPYKFANINDGKENYYHTLPVFCSIRQLKFYGYMPDIIASKWPRKEVQEFSFR
jgi:hypothetical protein